MRDDFDKYAVRDAIELVECLASTSEVGPERAALTTVRDLLERVYLEMKPGLLDVRIAVREAYRRASSND